MSIWAIIPVKPLKNAKSRLATVLSPEQRYEFAEAMFRKVLEVVTGIAQIRGTLVISRDTKALSIAREYKATTVRESRDSNLNPALMRATMLVESWGAQANLILPADLPFVGREDILQIIDLGQYNPSMVIATDPEQDGTNALFVRPAGLIHYQYGIGSYQRHIDLAQQAGAEVAICSSEPMMLDIDVPEDLIEYHQILATGDYPGLPVFYPDEVN